MHKRDQETTITKVLSEGRTVTEACKKAGLTTKTFYRLYDSNERFKKEVDEAKKLGLLYNGDVGITAHLKKIHEGHWPAIKYLIEHHVSPYKENKAINTGLFEEVLRLQAELRKHEPLPSDIQETMIRALKAQGLIREKPMNPPTS